MLGEFIILPRKNDVKEFINYIDNYPKEVAELELVPYDSNIIGEHVINEIERNIDKCK